MQALIQQGTIVAPWSLTEKKDDILIWKETRADKLTILTTKQAKDISNWPF